MERTLHHVVLGDEESGGRTALVVLHGLFGSSTNWRSTARRLASGRRVIAADLRNHGASPHDPDMDYAALAADVRALMDRLDLERAALLGHSMGGKTAMRLALESPDRVERLVVVDIAPAPSPGDHLPYARAMRALDPTRLGSRADADAALAGAVPDAALRAFLLQNLVREDDGYRWRIALAEIEAAMPALGGFEAPDGARFEGPVLFVRGARSDYVRDTHRPLIEKLFPRAAIHTVEGAGHWVHAERPDAFVAAVARFLESSTP